jgi:hypothetical protein
MGTLKELLAKPDGAHHHAAAVPARRMKAVLDIIRRDVAADKIQVDNPTQNLESYFLEVVRKAREGQSETSGATSGATSGSRVAAYLRGDAESAPTRDKLLERLTVSNAAPAPAQPAPTVDAGPKIDQVKLASLAKTAAPEPPPPPPQAKPVSEAELKKADEKLSSLLGQPPAK